MLFYTAYINICSLSMTDRSATEFSPNVGVHKSIIPIFNIVGSMHLNFNLTTCPPILPSPCVNARYVGTFGTQTGKEGRMGCAQQAPVCGG